MPKRFLKFSDRWMFNRVLCEKEVCRKVLRAALGIEVGEITYLNAEQAKEPAAASRGVRMDVFAREGSRVFDIEMQVSPEDRIGRRMRYYQAAIDATELGPGEDYGLLPESFVVFFCATDPFRAGEAVYSRGTTRTGACSMRRPPRMSPTPTCAICYTTWRRGGPTARCPAR